MKEQQSKSEDIKGGNWAKVGWKVNKSKLKEKHVQPCN